jgi:DNA-binding winged helix-turn-helix (wHTH) protein/tetratricopeptide (TPR) repeat protein
MAEGPDRARSSAGSDPVQVRFDRFELDEANARLLRDGRALALAPTPFALLCALARQPGSLLTKNALLDQVWGHKFFSDSVLKTAISDLRTVLDDDPRNPRFIETVSRRGYRFIAATAAIPTTSAVQANVPGIGSPHGSSFIGRVEALAGLRRAWDAACSGRRAVVWVAGEPGIGKTTLIDHFVASLGDIACARGQCVDQYGAGEPYLPVLEALGELCRRDSTLPALLRTVAPAWLLQLPWLCTADERDALRRELAGVSPDRMLREAGEAFDRYAERRPLLLVTEDLHWSDRSTVQLIDYIARRRGGARLMWLASFRLAEAVALDHPLNSLRRELRLHGLCEEVVLDPFSEREVADYVAQRSSTLAGDEALVRALHERTDGLPLFVAAVTSEIVARAAQGGDDAGAEAQLANLAVPENLAAIIDHYIARLDDDQRTLLSAAAVCGVEFRVGTVSDVLELDADVIVERCDRLARARLWLAAPPVAAGSDSPEQPHSFRHALFRQVLYERTPLATRTQLHRKVGAALERERLAGVAVAAAELATHFERGREPTIALRYYAEAAEDALAHLSPAECMSLTERGMTLLQEAPEGIERKTLEISLAALRGLAATHVLGMGPEAKSAFERAYSLLGDVPQHPMRRRLLHGLGFLLGLRADYAEALLVAERAEALASATNDPVLVVAACVAHGEVDQLQGRSSAALTWIERGLAAAEPLETAVGEIFVADPQVTLLGLLGVQLLHLGLVAQARGRLQRAHARARSLGQPMSRLVAIWFDALCEVRLGAPERVAALADEMCALVDEFALAQGRAACRWFRGWADARMGNPREAYRRICEGYEENAQLGMLAGSSEVRGYAAEALLLAGDWDAAQEELDEALRFANAHEERIYLPQLLLIEAAIARARGQSAAARTSVRRAVAESRALEAPWLELIALLELCRSNSATSEDRDALAALVEQLPEAIDTAPVATARALLAGAKAE